MLEGSRPFLLLRFGQELIFGVGVNWERGNVWVLVSYLSNSLIDVSA